MQLIAIVKGKHLGENSYQDAKRTRGRTKISPITVQPHDELRQMKSCQLLHNHTKKFHFKGLAIDK